MIRPGSSHVHGAPHLSNDDSGEMATVAVHAGAISSTNGNSSEMATVAVHAGVISSMNGDHSSEMATVNASTKGDSSKMATVSVDAGDGFSNYVTHPLRGLCHGPKNYRTVPYKTIGQFRCPDFPPIFGGRNYGWPSS